MFLKAVYKIDAREGAHNRIVIEYENNNATVKRFCETKYDDEFVKKEIIEKYKIDLTKPIDYLKNNMIESTGNDYELTVDNRTISGDYDKLPDYLFEFQNMIDCDFGFKPQSEKMKFENISEKKLKELLSNGIIDEKKFNEIIESIEKKKEISNKIKDKTYPFSRSPKEMAEDCDSGNLSRELFDCFVWCIRNVKSEKGNVVRIKLRLSLWGQRLLGRYDTCEYVVQNNEVSERKYSVHGTLFEGCGNYKAPESANIHDIGKNTSDRLFSFVQGLKNNGVLEKDYSIPSVDCSYFDLYVKYEDGTQTHTKGTSEYPAFIKFIMYLIDAKDLI